MAYRAPMPTFAGGEISPSVAARYDTQKYQTALDKGRNTLGLASGGQYNRPGFEFCDYTIDEEQFSELFGWSFSVDQSYALEFGDQRMHVFWDGALVTEPALLITAATQTNPLTVTIPASGYTVGRRIYFSGVEGMVQINGRTLTITAQAGDVSTFGDVDATAWGAFTGSGGGVPGDDEGGTGGYPPPPAPGDPDPEPPTYPDTDPVDPPRCVWVRAFIGDYLRAADAVVGTPLRMLADDGRSTQDGSVEAIRFDTRPGFRLQTISGVVLTCSDTAPVPVMVGGAISLRDASAIKGGDVVAVYDRGGLRWEPVKTAKAVGDIEVAHISAGDGVYLAGDIQGRGIFTHNKRYEPDPY